MNHGHHWNALYEDINAKLGDLIASLCKHGSVRSVEPCEPPTTDFRYIVGREAPLTMMGVIRCEGAHNEFLTGYPVMFGGQQNELEVLQAEEITDDDEDPDFSRIEGLVTCITKDGAEIAMHCPIWLSCRTRLANGGRYLFDTAGLAYTLEKATTDFEITRGEMFEMEKARWCSEHPGSDPSSFRSIKVTTANLRTYFQRDEGDVEFQSVIESAAPFESMDVSGHVLGLRLTPDGRHPIRVSLFASSKVLGSYTPLVGDSVIGIAWLQAVPCERVDSGDSWLDSAEAAHGAAI